jgi:hypothetical protein
LARAAVYLLAGDEAFGPVEGAFVFAGAAFGAAGGELG